MWRMVGRPERTDPDEFLYSLFHSSYADKGYDFIGYINPEYDKLAEKQRTQLDREERRKTRLRDAGDHQPRPALGLPGPSQVSRWPSTRRCSRRTRSSTRAASASATSGPSSSIEPLGAQKDLIINSNEAINATNPLYIGGAVDSWITDLIWDRMMRIGPDGMPQPWAAESVTWIDDKTIDVKLRAGMKWHDGKPVTVDDVIFSFKAPAGDKAPMYKPFVTDIAAIEKTGDLGLRFKLKQTNATFLTASLSQDQPDPQAHLGAGAEGPRGQAGERRADQGGVNRIGSGPFKIVRWEPNEEILLERFGDHFEAPKVERWIMRIVPNAEATLGMLKRGELNFLGIFGGDPEVLVKFAKDNPDIAIRSEIDIGFEYVAFNNRRPPFDDVAFRRALSLAIDRRLMVSAAWQDFADPGQQPRLAGADLLARPVGRPAQDRPRRGQEDPAGRRLPRWSAASSTTRPASRKS